MQRKFCCIPKSKDEKGYIGGKNSLYTQTQRRKRVYCRKNSLYTQIKRQERVYCRKKLAVYPNQKARKGILSEKTRCIPKSKGKKGYIGGKNSLYTQIKRQERVYCRKKLAVYPKYNLSRKNIYVACYLQIALGI